MKRYIIEFMGTFFLALAIALLGGNALGLGAMLTALIYIGAHISGAHYNPAFTTSAFLSRGLTINAALNYILFQIVGAFLALSVLYVWFKVPYVHPMALEKWWVILSIEFLFSLLFVLVFLAFTRAGHLKNNHVYGLAIGSTLLAIAFYGGLYNPAVAVGSLALDFLVKKQMTPDLMWHVIIRVAAPLAAAVVGAHVHRFINED